MLGTRRLGKRVVIALEGDLFLVVHLMIAGRLHWHAALGKPPAKTALATFESEQLGEEASKHAGWPPKVTAFHPQMAVHGRCGQPCPVCGSKVQRIVHGSQAPTRASHAAPRVGAAELGAALRSANETNYCARCQTGGKLLADRALSKLLHASWPKHIDDIEPS